MRKITLILITSFTLTVAQSFFNIKALGEIVHPVDAYSNATGNHHALSIANPGNYLELDETTLKLSIFGTGILARQNGMQRATGDVKPGAFYGAIPLPTGTRILLNADSRFNQDFDIWSESVTPVNPYQYHITSRGGIYALNLGIAQTLLHRLCLGVQIQQLIGASKENWHYITGEGTITTDTIETNYTGRNLRLGVTTRILLFDLGGSYELPTTITARSYKHLHGSATDTTTTYRLTLPGTFAFAISALPFPNLRIGTGIDLRPWSRTTITTPDTILNPNYQNAWRWSIGFEYNPFTRFPIRAGYSRNRWYYEVLNNDRNSKIEESGIHLGTAIPLPQFGALEVAGEILFRTGNARGGIIKENAARLIITFAYRERWEKRTRRWGY